MTQKTNIETEKVFVKSKQDQAPKTIFPNNSSETPKIGNKADLNGLNIALGVLTQLQKRWEKDGFSRYTFCFGLFNIGLSVWILGVYPEYYWIMFLAKFIILLSIRLYLGYKAKDNYYLLDFCWFSVFSVLICFFLVLVGVLEGSNARIALRIWFTFSCGPQGWSAIIFSNSLVFHSVMHTCSVFIHLTPVMLCYTIRWNLNKLNSTFPDIFPVRDNLITNDLINDLYVPSLIAYSCWFVMYTFWLCFHGLSLPAKGHDTVFNWLYTTKSHFRHMLDSIAYKLFRQKKNQQTKLKVLIYMVQHLMMVLVTMFWSFLCYKYQFVHILFIFILCISVLWQSSGYYQYITVKAPQKEIKKLIEQLQEQSILIKENENIEEKDELGQEIIKQIEEKTENQKEIKEAENEIDSKNNLNLRGPSTASGDSSDSNSSGKKDQDKNNSDNNKNNSSDDDGECIEEMPAK